MNKILFFIILIIILVLIYYFFIKSSESFNVVSDLISKNVLQITTKSIQDENILNLKKNVFVNETNNEKSKLLIDPKIKNELEKGGNFIYNTNQLILEKLCLGNTCFSKTDFEKINPNKDISYSYDPIIINDNKSKTIHEAGNYKTNMPQFEQKIDSGYNYIHYDKDNANTIPNKLCFDTNNCIEKKHFDKITGKKGIFLSNEHIQKDYIVPYNIEFGWRGLGFSDVATHLFYKHKDNAEYECSNPNYFDTGTKRKNCYAPPSTHNCEQNDNIGYTLNSKENNYRIYPVTDKNNEILKDSSYYHIH